jgi:hypothetical protein
LCQVWKINGFTLERGRNGHSPVASRRHNFASQAAD